MNKEDEREPILDAGKLPRHIAIIMDGNGRWAKKRLMPRTVGHRAGMASLKKIVRASSDIGISVLTVYAFSTENWKRPRTEVDYLMNLLIEFLRKEIDELHREKVKIGVLGDYEPLPQECKVEIERALQLTANNNGLILNIALNYGSRREIIRAVEKIAEKVLNRDISINDIDEQLFAGFLYTADCPDPDLLIRTAGENRISNFLLWQIAYSELWITETLWPDFSRKHLVQAIYDYQHRERRFGGLGK